MLADDLQDLKTDVILASTHICVEMLADESIAYQNFYIDAGIRGVNWHSELCYSSPSLWNNQTCVRWREKGRK